MAAGGDRGREMCIILVSYQVSTLTESVCWADEMGSGLLQQRAQYRRNEAATSEEHFWSFLSEIHPHRYQLSSLSDLVPSRQLKPFHNGTATSVQDVSRCLSNISIVYYWIHPVMGVAIGC
jgi:hypothetical protein